MNVLPDDRLLHPASERHADAGGGQAAAPASGQILIVDDNQDAADSLAMLLEYLGRTVRVANSGQAALDMLQDFRPEVILMDIGMPGMDGLEAARRIRKLPSLADATLIALSGWGQEEDKRRASESGFDHHLTKPVDLRMLEALLADADKRR
jgi:CheY-like chemotaxis protein